MLVFFRWPATSWQWKTHCLWYLVHSVFCHVFVTPLQSECRSNHTSIFTAIPLYQHVDIQQAGSSPSVWLVYQRLGSQAEEETGEGGNLGQEAWFRTGSWLSLVPCSAGGLLKLHWSFPGLYLRAGSCKIFFGHLWRSFYFSRNLWTCLDMVGF